MGMLFLLLTLGAFGLAFYEIGRNAGLKKALDIMGRKDDE